MLEHALATLAGFLFALLAAFAWRGIRVELALRKALRRQIEKECFPGGHPEYRVALPSEAEVWDIIRRRVERELKGRGLPKSIDRRIRRRRHAKK